MASFDLETVRAASSIDVVVAELTGQTLKRRGKEWIGLCPFHRERNPSLNVNREKGTFLCRSCGEGGNVFTFVEKFNGGTFHEALCFLAERAGVPPTMTYQAFSTPATPTPEPPRPSRIRDDEIERQHLYGDGLLRKVLLKKRTADGKKHMLWEHRDTVSTKWFNGTGTLTPGLYRFDEARALISESGKLVIAEGEKDVDALLALEPKLPATCLPHGATGKWLGAYSAALLAANIREVISVGDHDPAGEMYNRTPAVGLADTGIHVRGVMWPTDAPSGFDVSDVVARDGTKARRTLVALFDEAREMTVSPVPSTSVASNWPVPAAIEEELPPVEPFALDLLPVSFQSLVQDVTERMQVPMDYPALTSVLCLAGVVSRRALMQPKVHDTGWLVTPNTWGAIVGPPGVKKTPSIEAITRPLIQIQTEWRETFDAALVEHERAHEEHELRAAAWKKDQFKYLAKNPDAALSERPSEDSAAPTLQRLIIGDATFEVMHTIMRDNPAGLLMIRDELTGWLSELDRHGREGERAFCLSAWNGNTGHTIDRVERGNIYVPHCCLSIVGGIQPGRLRAYLVDALRDGPSNDGLVQRFQLMVWPDVPKEPRYVDRAPDAVAEATVARIFRRLVDLDAEHSARFTFSPEAQALFIDWFEELETRLLSDDLPPALASHLAKYRSLMPTLALLFELADRASSDGFDAASLPAVTPTVSVEHAKQAAAWCAYLESHAVRIYSCVVTPQRRAARVLAQRIKTRKLDAVFSVREVHHKNWSGLDSTEVVKSAAEYLQDAGWLRSIVPEPGPGRPSEQYEVNPMVWK